MADSTTDARKTAIEKYRNYFDGDVSSHYAGFGERFTNGLSTSDTVAKYQVPIQNMVRVAINKKMALIPLAGLEFEVVDNDGEVEEGLDCSPCCVEGKCRSKNAIKPPAEPMDIA